MSRYRNAVALAVVLAVCGACTPAEPPAETTPTVDAPDADTSSKWADVCDTLASTTDRVGWLTTRLAREAEDGVDWYGDEPQTVAAVESVCPEYLDELAEAQRGV